MTETPEGGAATRESLEQFRLDVARTIKQYFHGLFWLTVFVALLLVTLISIGFFTGNTMSTAVLAASVQVAFGMVIGFVCVYIGLMMTWFGIDAAYEIQAKLGPTGAKAEGTLKSASPGLLFALAGIALIAVSLYKPIVYQKEGLHLSGTERLGTSGAAGLPKPDPVTTPPPRRSPTPSSGLEPGGVDR